jgi:hypothetical protein
MGRQENKMIADLGLAAWVKMHGHRITRVEPRRVYFSLPDHNSSDEIESLKVSYVNSEASAFDSWLMSLKQMPSTNNVDRIDPSVVEVEGLGPSAYIRFKGRWRLIGRTSPLKYVFYVPVEDQDEFADLRVSWTNSRLRDFDAAMMSIKMLRISN